MYTYFLAEPKCINLYNFYILYSQQVSDQLNIRSICTACLHVSLFIVFCVFIVPIFLLFSLFVTQ